MNMKFLIVDDEPLAQRVIEKYAADIPTIEIAGKCESAFEAMEFIYNNEVDLLFLDINMPKLSGMDFLKSLKNPPIVVVTTAYRDYAVESYELDVVDYLKKPFSFERFFKAVQKAQEKFKYKQKKDKTPVVEVKTTKEENYIFIKADGKIYKVDYNSIMFIQAFGDYVKIFTQDSKILSSQSMKAMEDILPKEKFTRVHRSYIISLDKINLIMGNTVKILEHEIPVGKSYRNSFFERINKRNI